MATALGVQSKYPRRGPNSIHVTWGGGRTNLVKTAHAHHTLLLLTPSVGLLQNETSDLVLNGDTLVVKRAMKKVSQTSAPGTGVSFANFAVGPDLQFFLSVWSPEGPCTTRLM